MNIIKMVQDRARELEGQGVEGELARWIADREASEAYRQLMSEWREEQS